MVSKFGTLNSRATDAGAIFPAGAVEPADRQLVMLDEKI
jgi:hypothetical protein